MSLADSERLDRIYISETDKEISHLGLANSSAVLHPAGTVVLSRDAGVKLADYVILHELAHLFIHNHGPQFRALLDRSMPDWKKRQEELQKKAAEIYWCRSEMTG